ncbi:MAG: flagellar FlbD family protein [Acidimicrobiales bacterium]
MIALSKLDGSTMFLNEDHVERVEQGANSAVYLTNGTYLIVRDDVDTINERIRSEKAGLLALALSPATAESLTTLSAVPDTAAHPGVRS